MMVKFIDTRATSATMGDPWWFVIMAVFALSVKNVVVENLFGIIMRSSLQLFGFIGCLDGLVVAPQAHEDDEVGQLYFHFLFVVVYDEGIELLDQDTRTVVWRYRQLKQVNTK